MGGYLMVGEVWATKATSGGQTVIYDHPNFHLNVAVSRSSLDTDIVYKKN
jgi:hypothetical protein